MITGLATFGLEEVVTNLQRDLQQRGKELTYRGLVRGGLLILRDAVRGAPVDTTNLRTSGYAIGKKETGEVQQLRRAPTGNIGRGLEEVEHVKAEYIAEAQELYTSRYKIAVQVGFTASYAAAVHEGDPTYHWNVGGPQFLRLSVAMHYNDVLRLATEEVSKI